MSLDKVNIDEMAKAVMKNLEDYKDLATDELNKAVKSAAKTVRSEIKEHAPKRTGTYRDSWTTTTLSENSSSILLVVHSKTRYMLAHLLEKGHAKRGGGRVEGRPHIAPAEQKGREQLERDIVAALERK